ncbi:MAG: FecR domain-containing protein [Propionivibrio sp.]|uniref:FecR domain-containing protein n=1 Tax=Candidatus Propionivibrio dominans TaxID=2954373 RepID=A0A9D7FDD1_9RHOO|nr:FecR domain-containing protein [Candidatus Propionivibrio dominans]
MKKLSPRFLLAACLLLCGTLAQAVPTGERDRAFAVVDSVQMPAWVEHNGVRQPLEPGKVLQNRDRVITGADARVLIQLAEGSAVKLGENAQLDLNALGWRENRVFTAALDVARGAFRFTTDVFAKLQQRRAVNVRIATITAGIRGTDLWGSSDAERDLVCLLEGRITVWHPEDEVREMSEALSFYVVPSERRRIRWAASTLSRSANGRRRRRCKRIAAMSGAVVSGRLNWPLWMEKPMPWPCTTASGPQVTRWASSR